MYKKKGIETAPQNKYTAVLNPLTLLSLICARSLTFVLFCMLLLQQNERKKESERGEYKSTASPPPPSTHTTTLLLPHIHTFSLILYIYSLFCAATAAAAAAQPASCVLANTLCTIASPSWPLVRQLSDVLKSQTRTRNATQRKF